ncbi:hypothetical protein [Aromatoleum anaerobium]|uniref:Transmembrane protein n=1 Tax=Aromatoleum anaerobium TaxID=182180 RepID=A0ABX1PL72_9RHOO|nr:hypothetical protein [Aromatoleum anaerobium]MCK0507083.1 hypothetical protein [Aromatoleum anaerobium]
MKSHTLKLLAALVAGGAMLTALPAHADRGDREWRGHDREWRDHDRDWRRHDREWRDDDRGHRHGHYKKHWKHDHERVVIRERIVERRPVVREYRYYERPSYYVPPAPVYSRDPAIVIGVSVPPIVIPIR